MMGTKLQTDKPREFWIYVPKNNEEFTIARMAQLPDLGTERLNVIEKSAYDELKAELNKLDAKFPEAVLEIAKWKAQADKLAEALEFALISSGPKYEDAIKLIAKDALAQYRGEKT